MCTNTLSISTYIIHISAEIYKALYIWDILFLFIPSFYFLRPVNGGSQENEVKGHPECVTERPFKKSEFKVRSQS